MDIRDMVIKAMDTMMNSKHYFQFKVLHLTILARDYYNANPHGNQGYQDNGYYNNQGLI